VPLGGLPDTALPPLAHQTLVSLTGPRAWSERAAQNLRAAMLCIARTPPLPLPAVSRIYYATFQATVAALRERGFDCSEHHGDVWRAAERCQWGLGRSLWRLYTWRRRADYATGSIGLERARELVAEHATTCRSLGITEA
jgi:uncharacterized protein (UPF0332 family)